MNGMMRPHDSYVSICKTICPLLKKKVLFVFMFPFRIMVLTRKKQFSHDTYHHILPKNVREISTSQSDNDLKFPAGFS